MWVNLMEEQDTGESRLRKVYDALQAPELSDKLNWTKGADLVADGMNAISAIDPQKLRSDPELKRMGQYVLEQMNEYMSGQRSDVYTRRKLMLAMDNSRDS
jgi:hypothetical protein